MQEVLQAAIVVIGLAGVLSTWLLGRNYKQPNTSDRVFDAAFDLTEQLRIEVDRKNAVILTLESHLKAWRNFAFSLRDQLWKEGIDPEHDEPTNSAPLYDDNFAFINALLDAFDLASFDRMIRTIGKRREALTTANGLRAIAFDVVQVAQREGWLNDLKTKAVQANPNNSQLRKAIN